jgi:hypothetical protein
MNNQTTTNQVKLAFATLLLVILRATGSIVIAAILISTATADEPKRRHEHHNYILERQEAYQVQGPPTGRLIIGKRQIDIYPNGLMFEGNHVVGVRGR